MPSRPSADPRFRAIFDAHHRELHAYCLRRLGVHDANDAAADVLFAAWRHVDEIPSKPRPWLFRLARRAVDMSKHGRAQVRVVARDGLTVPVVSGAGAVQLVRHPNVEVIHQRLAELRDIDREIVQLSVWEGLSTEEIAATLGLSVRSVAHRRDRALSRLAARVADETSDVDERRAAEQVGAANPLPALESLPHSALSAGALLALVDQRQAPEGPLTPLKVDGPSGGGRGLLLAGVIAAASVLVILFLVVGLVGPPERRTPPPTTTPPSTLAPVRPQRTAVPDTTVPPALMLPADTPALEVVEAVYARWSRADIAGYRALIDDAVTSFNLASMDHSAWYRFLSGAVDVRSCRAEGSSSVHCSTVYYSGLAHGQRLFQEEVDFTVENGRIVSIEPRGQLGLFNVGYDRDGLVSYRNWFLARSPDRFEPLFAFGTTILLHTPELRDAHQTLMDEYRVETAPSTSLHEAMPIKVVDTYYGHLRAADFESARELVVAVSQDANGLVPDPNEMWYFDVTGMAMGRICDALPPIQVRCDVTYYSGLAPGVDLTGHILLYTVVEGRIVDIEALGPIESFVTADESALAAYRGWLFTADPFAAAAFFTEGGALALDTDEARTAHRRYIAQYLEELRG